MESRTATVLKRAVQSVAETGQPTVTDRELLRRYAKENDQAAFEALVTRHTVLVLGVCRRALTSVQDAEDACQATFLLLARKAGSVNWQASAVNWLYATARKVAHNARVASERRAKREARSAVPEAVEPVDRMTVRELLTVLDEELSKLSARYREAVVLCHLEGLSLDEAAPRLGIPVGTLKTRIARGRKRLADALTSRGCALGVGLLALAVTSPAGASSPRLVKSILATASGSVPAAVGELVKGVAVNGTFNKAVVAVEAVVIVALGVGLGALGSSVAGQPPDKTTPNTTDSPPAARSAPPAEDVTGTVTYAGRVLDPDGKPVAGAKLYVLYSTPNVLPIPDRGKSDRDGNFRLSVEKKEFDRSDSPRPWNSATVVAVADGYGLGVPGFEPGKPGSYTDLTLRMPKDDAPVTGRVLNLQGQPVVGATVSVHAVFWPRSSGDLTDWLAEVKMQKAGYPVIRKHLTGLEGDWMGRDVGRLFPPPVTDKEGRFQLKGVGRERVVALRIEGPTIVSTDLWAMTRPGDTFQAAVWTPVKGGPEMTFVGADFGHHVAPSRPIVGVVRDKDTGKPLRGAVVQSYMFAGTNLTGATHLRAVADKEGRYRLSGMPKGEGNRIRVGPPEGEPYLMALARVPDAPGVLEPVTVDVQLKRGVWITGKVTDKVTGEPVHALIKYTPFEDNPNRLDAPGLTFDDHMQARAGDGTFRFVGFPGRAVVTATSTQPGYLAGVGIDRIKDFDRVVTGIGRAFDTVVEVNPEKGAESAACDIVLEPGRTLVVLVVGPDGGPLDVKHVSGLRRPGSWNSLLAGKAKFAVVGVRPDEQRLLQFVHAEKKLAGSLVVRGDAKGPLQVKLDPAGVLTGRFVTTDGKPLADLEVVATGVAAAPPDPRVRPEPDLTAGSFPPGLRTDADGKFRIEGLAPGLTYRAALFNGKGLLYPEADLKEGVNVKAGETKDIGDIKVKLPDQ